MGSKSLRYFRYMLKHKPGKLLGGFTVPAIIQNTTTIHPFVNQSQSKDLPRDFALQLDYLCVLVALKLFGSKPWSCKVRKCFPQVHLLY
jgi:hypothetical protein